MASVFPTGMNYLMFNLNGHPYFGIKEKITLWEWYQKELDIPEKPDIRIMKLTIDGDMAWLGCEGIFPLRSIGASGTGSETWRLDDDAPLDRFRLRATEIYPARDGRCGRCGISTARRFRPRQRPVRRSRTPRRTAALAGIPGPIRFASSGGK
jgi:hypothetical protein